MMKRKILPIPTLLILFILTVTGCSQVSGLSTTATSTPPPAATAGAPVVTDVPTTNNALAALEGSLEQIYEGVSPSVVNIQITQEATVDLPIFQTPQSGEPQEFYRHGAGSGFIWDTAGHIVTNNHVIADADKITVTFADGTFATGEVVGTDPDSDLAVIKVDAPANLLQPVQLADSGQVQVGELVVAIGNPFALKGTMTVGFISALGRLLPVEAETSTGPHYNIPDVIQTDAPINPGNSGGVLVDDTGRVIGVTSAIISPSRASAGIGFAIPSAIVEKVIPALIANGYYEHTYLGVSLISLNPDLNQEMGLDPDQRGTLIEEVAAGSPADEAGLHGSDRQVTIEGQPVLVGGDAIVAIDGETIKTADDLITYLVRHTKTGETVTLSVLREGEKIDIDVILTARPQEQTRQGARLGIAGVTMIPALAEAMKLPNDQQGILIEQIEAGSSADEAGLYGSYKPVTVNGRRFLVGGDIVIAFNDKPTNSVANLQTYLDQANPGEEVTLTIIRDGQQIDVPVRLGEQ